MARLLFFVDEGGFDDPSALFIRLGYQLDFEDSKRKVVKLAKQNSYEAVVAEFSYNPEFRDRVSNIESLLATLESTSPEAKIIVLYDEINQAQLNQLAQRYRIDHMLKFPVDEQHLTKILS